MAEVRVYTCPDGVTRTLDPLLRDCPETTVKANLDTSGAAARPTRFLGARGELMSEADAAKLLPQKENSPFGEPDRRFMWYGILGVIVLFLFFIRRRKGHK